MNQHIYFYLINGKKYIDFHMLLNIYAVPENTLFERSNLWRYLGKSRIKNITIGNKKVYSLEDVFSDADLVGKMQNISILADNIEE